jgi:hypothetical protein
MLSNINKINVGNIDKIMRKLGRILVDANAASFVDKILRRACEERHMADVYIDFAMRICTMYKVDASEWVVNVLVNGVLMGIEAIVERYADVDHLPYDEFCTYVKTKSRILGSVQVLNKLPAHVAPSRVVADVVEGVKEIVHRVGFENKTFLEIVIEICIAMTTFGRTEEIAAFLDEFQASMEAVATIKTSFRMKDLRDAIAGGPSRIPCPSRRTVRA